MGLDKRLLVTLGVSAALRLVVFVAFPNIADFLTAQVEISTPISSFKRLQEGLFLYSRGVSPYDGGVFHQAPLLLAIHEILPTPGIYTILDLLNAVSLYRLAQHVRIPSPRFKAIDPLVISAAYLFNPFTILSCLGRSTSLFTNTAIIQAVFQASSGNAFEAMFSLAFGTYISLYPALLLPPVLLLYLQSISEDKPSKISVLWPLVYFTNITAILLATTPLLTGSFTEFLSSCYGAQITVTDLTPNVGLWWYFFIEIFDAFRDFFIGVFWLHLIAYVGGLTIRLSNQPLFVVISLLGLFAIFRPYPSISDVSLYLGFLPLYQHILPLTRYLFIAASVLLYSTLLGPAFYHLWIYAGSGNANFFYAITLVWSLGLTILVGDTLYAVLRDEWEVERPEMRGKDARRI